MTANRFIRLSDLAARCHCPIWANVRYRVVGAGKIRGPVRMIARCAWGIGVDGARDPGRKPRKAWACMGCRRRIGALARLVQRPGQGCTAPNPKVLAVGLPACHARPERPS